MRVYDFGCAACEYMFLAEQYYIILAVLHKKHAPTIQLYENKVYHKINLIKSVIGNLRVTSKITCKNIITWLKDAPYFWFMLIVILGFAHTINEGKSSTNEFEEIYEVKNTLEIEVKKFQLKLEKLEKLLFKYEN
uniref:Uncharacterized protein n=1 Tax=Rhizophagus irregularis (strain DAOM 181602 / DAOM 197198 / MUCL 43194) TaxID=747089 RepID=U9UGU4_RHIID